MGLAATSTYKFDPLQHLAGIAPYFEPEDPQLDPAPPQGCKVTRVYIEPYMATEELLDLICR
jgi:hypothetical protein